MGLSVSRASTQAGSQSATSPTGNSYSTDRITSSTARWPSSRQLTARQVTPCAWARASRRAWAPSLSGRAELTRIRKGLPSSFSSAMTRRSASTYASRGRSVIVPSVVTTTPIVECSAMTRRVPSSAASAIGISSADQGVRTMRGWSSSYCPTAPGTR